ncbi:MAG: hypothetical protein ABH871_08265 [Pseudomonadota bacterium]
MDLSLKALCMEVVKGNVDSERFAWLLIETGVNIDSYEWQVANNLLKQGDAIASLAKRCESTVH